MNAALWRRDNREIDDAWIDVLEDDRLNNIIENQVEVDRAGKWYDFVDVSYLDIVTTRCTRNLHWRNAGWQAGQDRKRILGQYAIQHNVDIYGGPATSRVYEAESCSRLNGAPVGEVRYLDVRPVIGSENKKVCARPRENGFVNIEQRGTCTGRWRVCDGNYA